MFLVIGELINATRQTVASALEIMDDSVIRRLASSQSQAGAHAIDINAAQAQGREAETMLWLIEIVESELGEGARISIDTADTEVMMSAIGACKGRPIVNSISNESSKQELLELAAASEADVIGLALGDRGMPKSSADRLAEAETLLRRWQKAGGDEKRLYIDIICMAVACSGDQGVAAVDAVRDVKGSLGALTFAAASNVSFGLPNRRLLNRAFLSMLVVAGLDGAVLDPTDQEMMNTLCAARAIAGADHFCLEYIRRHKRRKADA